jgi:hypothetical protein
MSASTSARTKAEGGTQFGGPLSSKENGPSYSGKPQIVIPAKAGIHCSACENVEEWIPAFAGMTIDVDVRQGYTAPPIAR